MSLSRNSNTPNDLRRAAKHRSKIPEIPEMQTTNVDTNKEKKVNKNKETTKSKKEVEKKNKVTRGKIKPEKTESKKAETKEVITNVDKSEEVSEPKLIVPPRSQVRVPAYSMAKIRAIMEIKGIRYSHEVINYLITAVEDKIFTETEKDLYDAQMEFQKMKFDNNGWDTEK